MAIPKEFIHPHPNARTIKMKGEYINCSVLARCQNCDQGYLSRILRGVRNPLYMSIGQGMKIAAALGMGLEELVEEIQGEVERQAQYVDEEFAKARAQRDDRLRQEVREDAQSLRRGHVPHHRPTMTPRTSP